MSDQGEGQKPQSVIDTREMLRQFAEDFNLHVLPTYLSEPAIAALCTLPTPERREIVSKLVGHAVESHNRGLAIRRMALRKTAPLWLKRVWAGIDREYPGPVASVAVRNEEGKL